MSLAVISIWLAPFFWYVDVRRPEDAIHDELAKILYAEVVVKMTADEAKGASAVGIAPARGTQPIV